MKTFNEIFERNLRETLLFLRKFCLILRKWKYVYKSADEIRGKVCKTIEKILRKFKKKRSVLNIF